MVKLCKQLSEAAWFQNFVTVVILGAGVLVGIETYGAAVEKYGWILHALDKVILGIFIFEIVVKAVAEMPKPWRYFTDAWNVFDFLIVVAALLPFFAQYATVLRLLRLLRVLRLVRALPKLQLLVGALIKSIPSMGYVSLLLGMLFYVYACAGVFLFGDNDPEHFGDLQRAFVSLFGVVTLEGWVDLMNLQRYGGADPCGPGLGLACPEGAAGGVAIFYFISFVLIGTMVTLNLFIGVIIGGMSDTQKETEEAAALEAKMNQTEKLPSLNDDIASINEGIAKLQERLVELQRNETARTKIAAGAAPEAAD